MEDILQPPPYDRQIQIGRELRVVGLNKKFDKDVVVSHVKKFMLTSELFDANEALRLKFLDRVKYQNKLRLRSRRAIRIYARRDDPGVIYSFELESLPYKIPDLEGLDVDSEMFKKYGAITYTYRMYEKRNLRVGYRIASLETAPPPIIISLQGPCRCHVCSKESTLPQAQCSKGLIPPQALPKEPTPPQAGSEGLPSPQESSAGPTPQAFPPGPIRWQFTLVPIPRQAVSQGPTPTPALIQGPTPGQALIQGPTPTPALIQGPTPRQALSLGPTPGQALSQRPTARQIIAHRPTLRQALFQGPQPGTSRGPTPRQALFQGPQPGTSRGLRQALSQGPQPGTSRGLRQALSQGPQPGTSRGPTPRQAFSQGPQPGTSRGLRQALSQRPIRPQGNQRVLSQKLIACGARLPIETIVDLTTSPETPICLSSDSDSD